MDKVSLEVAEKDVLSWLDFKRINAKKRETNASNIDVLTEAIVDGVLILDTETHEFTHKLKLPLEADGVVTVKEVKYKARIKVRDIQLQLKGVKSDDSHGMVIGYVSAITGQVKNVIAAFDTEDYAISQAIAVFFL